MQFDLPLRSIPSEEWLRQFDQVIRDPYVRHKYNRSDRIAEHAEYLDKYHHEFWNEEPGNVVDIGPGPGELLEIARAWGHDFVVGCDSPLDSTGGMGREYLVLSRLMHQRQDLPVHYIGLQDWIAQKAPWRYLTGMTCLVNMRGSLEQCYAEHLEGKSHEDGHDCHDLVWRLDPESVRVLEVKWRAMLGLFRDLLRPGGTVLIHCNGTATKENTVAADDLLELCARVAGLVSVHREHRLHKWVK